jgi:hypothetical protein
MRIMSSLAALAGILGVSFLARANNLPSCLTLPRLKARGILRSTTQVAETGFLQPQ